MTTPQMNAIGRSKAPSMLGQLWQMPLFVVALGAFGYSVYVFSDPGPGPTVGERIEAARTYVKADRPEPAITLLNKVLGDGKPNPKDEATAHLLLAEAVAVGQRVKKVSLPENHAVIVEQSKLAKEGGAVFGGADFRRLAESLDALAKPREAISAYRDAAHADAKLGPTALKRVIELLLSLDEKDAAEGALAEYLDQELSDVDQGWALGELAELMVGKAKYADARKLLAEILKLKVDDQTRGVTAYRYGLCAIELGDDAEAERQLRLARQLLKVRSPIDAEAALLLGRILQDRGQAEEAARFFNDVIVSHPDSNALIPARLGRGLYRIGKAEDDAGLTDLNWVAQQLQKPANAKLHARTVLAGLEKAETLLADRKNYQGALELLGLEKTLLKDPPAGFWARVAAAYERRAEQVEQAARAVDVGSGAEAEGVAERDALLLASRQLRIKAGDASFSHSMALTLSDNEGYGTALWRAMELYDRAGAVQSVILALERFVLERPSDPLVSEALLRLGKAYMAVGQFGKAINTLEKNRFRFGGSKNTLFVSQSYVPLAQALIATGNDGYSKAERVLLEVVDNNPALTPQATEFRNALFELAQLYYRQGRYEDSIARFDEILKRYPTDERLGQVLFLTADGYRKSAQLLERTPGLKIEAVKAGQRTSPGDDGSEAESARKQRLIQARALFDRVVAYHRDRTPTREIDKAQQRLAHFYRADCAFDLGQYDEAIKFYDQAAFRYQDDASALAAYVQIVNANVRLGRTAEARSANERAKWLLRRMPPSAFSDGSFALPRSYWEQWLKWSGETGLWPEGTGNGAVDGNGAAGRANSAGRTAGNTAAGPK